MDKQKIKYVVYFNIIIIVSELFFGFVSNSYALISDAMHNFGDIISLIVTYLTINLSVKANKKATLFNMIFLYFTMFYIIYEAILKLNNPVQIEASYMIIVGFIALLANGVSAYILAQMSVSSCASHNHTHSCSSHTHKQENIKSAYFHMLSDALISLGVIFGGVAIYLYQIYYLDSLLTIIFSIYILYHSYPLLKRSLV